MAKAANKGVAGALNKVFNSSEIKRVEVDLSPIETSGLVFMLENVLTPEECTQLTSSTELKGYDKSLIRFGDGTARYRDGFRIMIEDEKFTKILFSRISKFLPKIFKERELVEIHKRLRFLRYNAGDKFGPFKDGPLTKRDGSAKTLIALQIYLNDAFEGGETVFVCYNGKISEGGGVPIVPKTGMILVYEHGLYHEGALLRSGEKYIIRADVMYTNSDSGKTCSLI